jgi:hypothetical protein
MFLRSTILISCLILFLTSLAVGQGSAAEQSMPEEQNETMLDTLKRMQIKREEDEHKKLLDKGVQIKEDAEVLAKESNGQYRLARSAEKKLKNIEKFARQIRSDTGASDDEPLDSPPMNLSDTLKQLCEVSERLNTNLAKTSRRVISLAVVDDTTEIIQLAKLLRTYLY